MEPQSVQQPHPCKEAAVILKMAMEFKPQVTYSFIICTALVTAPAQQMSQAWVADKKEEWHQTKYQHYNDSCYTITGVGTLKVSIISIVQGTPWPTWNITWITSVIWHVQYSWC